MITCTTCQTPNPQIENDTVCPDCGIIYHNLTIHPVQDDDITMYWIVNGDGSAAFCIGEDWQVTQLYTKFKDLVEQGDHDGMLNSDDEQIIKWITVREAAQLCEFTERNIRFALLNNRIENAKRRPWRMPLRKFQKWLRDERAHRPGPK